MSAILIPFAWLYGFGARIHRGFMGLTRAMRSRPACGVVSVGGLTVGGAGKTPLAARLAAGLAARGHRVVLASRGYKGSTRAAVTLVSDGARLKARAIEVGDEPLVLAAHAPGVPVLVGRDRRVVGHHAVSELGAEILVLDDGFQHHRLARDLDIVAIDAVAGLGNGRVLPAGPLREPISSLRHADWICIVDGEEGGYASDGPPAVVKQLCDRFRREGRFVLEAHRRPRTLISLDGSERLLPEALVGRRVGLVCGIARPDSFRRLVESLGAEVVGLRAFPDHHAYAATDLRDLDPDLDLWLTTEKDAVKLDPAWSEGNSLFVLPIEMEIDDEARVLERIELALQASGWLVDGTSSGNSTRPSRSTSSRERSR